MREVISGGIGIRFDEAVIDIEDGGGEQLGWKFRVGRPAEKRDRVVETVQMVERNGSIPPEDSLSCLRSFKARVRDCVFIKDYSSYSVNMIAK